MGGWGGGGVGGGTSRVPNDCSQDGHPGLFLRVGCRTGKKGGPDNV